MFGLRAPTNGASFVTTGRTMLVNQWDTICPFTLATNPRIGRHHGVITT